ncbi:MAG: PPC domain-containing DNA-binding protein [Treponemataceae bacterium]
MRHFLGRDFKRIVVLNLLRGDKLLESIIEKCEEIGLKNGVVLSAIGSLQRAHFHRVISMAEMPEDEFVVIEKPLELASLQGLIVDGHPHFHMVVSDQGQAYTGHLENGTVVLYLVEICIAEIEGLSIVRKKGLGTAVYFDDK